MTPRLNRLFAADGKCFDVAVDHGLFGEPTFLAGIEDIRVAVEALAEAAPDAIQLSPGQARHLQDRPGPHKPALVLRTDVANVYGKGVPRTPASTLIDDPVGTAVRLDAACVVVNLLALPDQPELHSRSVENVCVLRTACERAGMPLMVEPLAMRPTDTGYYGVDGDADKIVTLVRQAVELGADVVKADPPDDLADYPRIIQAAGGVPVLPRGGGRAPVEEVLRRTAQMIELGASGIVYGRNIIQHPDPAGMTRALMAVVHDGASAEQALELVGGR